MRQGCFEVVLDMLSMTFTLFTAGLIGSGYSVRQLLALHKRGSTLLLEVDKVHVSVMM